MVNYETFVVSSTSAGFGQDAGSSGGMRCEDLSVEQSEVKFEENKM